MREQIKIESFKSKHPCVDLVARIETPHKKLNDRPIEVYCEDIIIDGRKTWFWLFNQGEYVGNPVMFPCNVELIDKKKIGLDMINELLSASDFRDLDLELQGRVPCKEYKDIYSKCEECELLRSGKGKDKEDACIGAMYSIPSHMNSWEKTEKKWNEIYGENTLKHKEYTADQMIGYMNHFMHICGNDKNLITEVLRYGKEHPANKHQELFV